MSEESRYAQQQVLQQIGEAGQQALEAGSAAIIGCGGLGSAAANALVRAGVGRVRLIDPDRVELSNLHRQLLFDEDDLDEPKVAAARRKLERINSAVVIESVTERVTPANIASLVNDVVVVVDSTDTIEARYLINDACCKLGKPWIYAGVTGTAGMVMTILPNQGPCFRCIFPSIETVPQQDSGVFGPIPAIIAGIQATEACKVLLGAATTGQLLSIDLWHHSWHLLTVERDVRCLCHAEAQKI